MSVQHLVVVGAGQMGTGIAQVALVAGYKVTLVDLSEDALGKSRGRIEAGLKRLVEKGQLDDARAASALGNFHGAVSLRDCQDVDFAIEAVTENENVKRRIFEEMDQVVRPGGVLATNTPDVLTETTADFGFALLMATARRVTESEHFLRAGKWTKWSYDMFAGAEVHGSTVGIIGMGRIGQGIARRAAHGFGMQVLYHNRSRLSPELELECKSRYVDKTTLLREADHVVLVVPYSAASHHTIGAAELAQMKPTATLVNIARGGIVDDAALAQALKERRIAAAGLDVFEGEPKVHPDLLTVPNVVLTPHIASATVKTRMAMAQLAADNLMDYLLHQRMRTPINPEVRA